MAPLGKSTFVSQAEAHENDAKNRRKLTLNSHSSVSPLPQCSCLSGYRESHGPSDIDQACDLQANTPEHTDCLQPHTSPSLLFPEGERCFCVADEDELTQSHLPLRLCTSPVPTCLQFQNYQLSFVPRAGFTALSCDPLDTNIPNQAT